jgi:hypothetical protein
LADRARHLSPNAAAALVLALVAVALLLWQRPWQPADGRDDGPAATSSDASAALAAQFRTMTDAGSQSAFVDAAGDTDAARDFAAEVWSARRELGAVDVRLRYVSGGDRASRADGSADAVVDVDWSGGDAATAAPDQHASVVFRVVPQGGGFAVEGARASDGPLPLWLAGAVSVERGDGTRVVRVDGGDTDQPLDDLVGAARDAVDAVVPSAAGDVTVVSPRTAGQMADIVGQPTDAVAQIAAVATSLDGRSGDAAGTAVVLNPEVFATMDRRAAQVVLTHEATHVLTGAVGADARGWVAEGFADYVALRDDRAPLTVSAGQVLDEVRAGRTPQRLPQADDFDAGRHGLGAVYESAWMAFRMLGERHDDAALVGFYEDVRDGEPVDAALRSSFGLTVAELTADWRDYLTKSASTVS